MKQCLPVFLFSITVTCFAQDTIKVEPSVYYTSEEADLLSPRGFFGKYGREDIVFSDSQRRVEYCYYEDSVRHCFGRNYRIANDSILLIGDSVNYRKYGVELEEWHYKKLASGNYYIWRYFPDSYEQGEVESLIPFRHVIPLVTFTADKCDTLWTTRYDYSSPSRPDGWVYYEFYTSKIKGKIYEYYDVDAPPLQFNGRSLPTVQIDGVIRHYCYNDPSSDISAMACIITKNGEIKNLEQVFGNITEYCPFTLMEIIKEIKTWQGINPARIKGEPVNVRWFITIDNAGRKYIHPAFADTDKRRRMYIEYKKKEK